MFLANHTYDYRLVDGKTPYEGRLEIRRDGGVWGPVISHYWTTTQASLACQSVGLSASVLWFTNSDKYEADLGPVHVKIFNRCPANAVYLMDCERTTWDDPEIIDDYEFIVSIKCLPGMNAL